MAATQSLSDLPEALKSNLDRIESSMGFDFLNEKES